MATKKPGQLHEPHASAGPLPDRRLMEQQLAAVSRLLAERDFASLEEANAYLHEALSKGGLPAVAPATPLEEAQAVIVSAGCQVALRRSWCWSRSGVCLGEGVGRVLDP